MGFKKEEEVYACKEMLFSLKKDGNSDICYIIDKT